MITITIPGDPIPKKRHCQTKKGITYDTQAQAKNNLKLYLKNYLACNFSEIPFPLQGPVHCEFYFYMPIPESFTKGQKSLISWNALEHTTKPDCDNLEKFYLDCMSQIVYEDDKRIFRLSSLKRYDENPRTEIRIMVPEQNVPDKAKQILTMFPSDELDELVDNLALLVDCLSTDFMNFLGASEEVQLQAAYSISFLADKYGALLNLIAKKYPGTWKSISEFEKSNYNEDLEKHINGFCYAPKSICEGSDGK